MLVSWDYEQTYLCPCGKGEYAHRWNDYEIGRGIKKEDWVMLCPDCKPHYVYDRRPTPSGFERPWKGEIPRRGWVRKEVVREEERYHQALRDFQRAVIQKVDDLCRDTWRIILAACKTKKSVWELADTHQSYSTFLSHNKGKALIQVIQDESSRPFRYDQLRHILIVCGMVTDPDSLVNVRKPTPPSSLPGPFQEIWGKGWDFSEPRPLSEAEIQKE